MTTPLNLTWFKRLPSSLVDQLYSSRQRPLTVPVLFVNCIADMSLVFGMLRAIQLLVLILLFTHITDLMGLSLCSLCDGYTTLKFVGVLMLLNVFLCGSWISISLYSVLSLLFISSR